jgi:hypothetical protein
VSKQSDESLGSEMRTFPKGMGDYFPHVPAVYFLAGDRKIKVGFTGDLSSRLQVLRSQTNEPLQVIDWVPGDTKLERAVLLAASRYRIKGEWFSQCIGMRAIIGAAVDGQIIPVEFPSHRGDENVAWASEALKTIAGPRRAEDRTKHQVGRVADLVGISYWRAFDLWYLKAHRLAESERASIMKAMEAANV